jgi:hypothetical protein
VSAETDKGRGLYDKYTVRRNDREDRPGYKHDGCQLFVLDLTHDPHAREAAQTYADTCFAEFPELSRDLTAAIAKAKDGAR